MSLIRTLAIAAFLTFTATCPAQTSKSAPNVLILLADDLGWNDVGFHAPAAPTPSINLLAKEGLELQRFYSYPVCSPARAALVTGQMPRRFGITDVVGPGQAGLPKGIATLPAAFRAAGYQTSLIGKWHLGSANPPMQCGFEHFYGFMGAEIDYFKHTALRGNRIDWQRDGRTLEEEGYSTYLFADEAIRQIQSRDAKRPFFIEVAFNAAHFPLAAPDDLVAKQSTNPLYRAVVEGLDLSIGRILAVLDEQKLRDNTIVLFYSDNGAERRVSASDPLSYGKGSVYEGGIRTPCVIRWPDHVPAGAITQQPVSGQDWFPTLAAAAGVPLPSNARLDGTNQWPALQTGKVTPRTPFLIAAHDIALIDGEWKLIEWNDSKRSLFNLRTDISEAKDLLSAEPGIAGRLSAKLAELKKDLPADSGRRGPGGGRPGIRGGAQSGGASPRGAANKQ
jgi:arylsulfatase A-like enzyme